MNTATLDELKKACGDKLNGIVRNWTVDGKVYKWAAEEKDPAKDDIIIGYYGGDTPEEAVLALLESKKITP